MHHVRQQKLPFIGSSHMCALFVVTTLQGAAQCGPKMEKKIADLRSCWVKNWNAGQLDDVVCLCATDADLLAGDGSRASGQNESRASRKQIGPELKVHSVPGGYSDAFAYHNGTYQQTAMVNPSRVSEGASLSEHRRPSLDVNATQRFCSSSTALLSPA
jgi:hypothetical protein